MPRVSVLRALGRCPLDRDDAAAFAAGEFDVDELVRRTRARYGVA